MGDRLGYKSASVGAREWNKKKEKKEKPVARSNTEVLAPARPSHRRAAESGGLDNVLGAAEGRESPESARVGNNSEAVP